MIPALLALEDGSLFYGSSIGIQGIRCGEVVFNTATTGYQEILTDPSYTEQIITFTYPHIGNVGTNSEDAESEHIRAAGVIMRVLSPTTSNWRAEQSLNEYLQSRQIVGITGIDTRRLTRILREKGFLKGCIMTGENDEQKALTLASTYKGLEEKVTSLVTTPFVYKWEPVSKKESRKPYHVVVIDFGLKRSILKYLDTFGCQLTVVPAMTSLTEILNLLPQGIVLSNGPGDPIACTDIIDLVKSLINTGIPILGICLGYQLLGLAQGAKTCKMRFGHHGANHPVIDLSTQKVMITSQNHGFMVDESSLPTILQPTHRSLFDQTLQGFCHIHKPIYGFQGHPEASPGPQDALLLFRSFIDSMKIRLPSFQPKNAVYDQV